MTARSFWNQRIRAVIDRPTVESAVQMSFGQKLAKRNHKKHKRHKRADSYVPLVLHVVSSSLRSLTYDERSEATSFIELRREALYFFAGVAAAVPSWISSAAYIFIF